MDIKAELTRQFGFKTFLLGQQEVIEKIMAGKSSAAIFPTGAGKSLCYQLPAMLQPHLTLVVSPLLSLMKDQLDFLHSHNIPAARLDSSLSRDEYNEIIRSAVGGELKILMISVERFKNERFRNQLKRMRLSLLVVDEAHCISEWGHNFRPEYLRLPDYRNEYSIEKVLLLTATATEKVVTDMCGKFQIKKENVISTGFYRPNLYLKVTPLQNKEKKKALLTTLSSAPDEPAIVYVTLQKTSEQIAAYLSENGLNAASYHGGMKNEDRVRIQNLFMAGRIPIVAATIAFGMGIDKKDIRRIIHFDLPKSLENYSQEIGRAGRDGKASVCEVYGNRANLPVLENFVYGDTPDRDAVSSLLNEIKSAGKIWEFKATGLSRDVNIRPLPLKTLLVYLSIRKIIQPKYSYFEEYSFKYQCEAESIIERFEGERRSFVQTLLKNCHSKKVWTSVDMETVTTATGGDRNRILNALDYFDAQGWIELTTSQAVEVYEVIDESFEPAGLSENLFTLFKEKEEAEIDRIHTMLRFFEGNSCYSRRLAAYYGEKIEKERCGHCSYCAGEHITLAGQEEKSDLNELNKNELTREASQVLKERSNPENLARFLCGLSSPLFTRLKIRSIKGFGALEEYPFMQVRKWLE